MGEADTATRAIPLMERWRPILAGLYALAGDDTATVTAAALAERTALPIAETVVVVRSLEATGAVRSDWSGSVRLTSAGVALLALLNPDGTATTATVGATVRAAEERDPGLR